MLPYDATATITIEIALTGSPLKNTLNISLIVLSEDG